MDLLLLIVEGVLWFLDVVLTGADVYSWLKGRENRKERRLARKHGVQVPPRDKWNRRAMLLTIVVCVITMALLIWIWLKA